MAVASNEERIARLEIGYEHLATKEDLAQLETRLLSATTIRIDRVSQRIDRVFWAVLGIGGALLATAVAALVRGAV